MYDISVIIPNYNGAAFLSEAIESVLNQENVDVEVIVVDDGSIDESREVLAKYGEKISVFYQENKGAPAARNVGWRNASAEYIKFLDSDDVLLPKLLSYQLKEIIELGDNQIPYGQAIWTDEKLNPVGGYPIKPIEPNQDRVHHILTENPLTGSPLHRKSLLERIGGFDESIVKGQEFDLHLRLVLIGVNLIFFDHPVYYFRQSNSILRISNKSLKKNHISLFQMISNQETMIRQSVSDFNVFIKEALSRRYLQFGKAIFLEKGYIQSIKYFLKYLILSSL